MPGRKPKKNLYWSIYFSEYYNCLKFKTFTGFKNQNFFRFSLYKYISKSHMGLGHKTMVASLQRGDSTQKLFPQKNNRVSGSMAVVPSCSSIHVQVHTHYQFFQTWPKKIRCHCMTSIFIHSDNITYSVLQKIRPPSILYSKTPKPKCHFLGVHLFFVNYSWIFRLLKFSNFAYWRIRSDGNGLRR